MSALEKIQTEILALPRPDVQALQTWIEDYLEDECDLTPEFAASVARAEAEIASGQGRIEKH
jgi:hypothetical protein